MSILAQSTQPVNVIQIGKAFLVIDKNAGFVTILQEGDDTNVVGSVAISELRKALGHSLGFATPREQTEDRRNQIISAVRFAGSKEEYDAAMATAYGYDAVLTGMLQKEYGYRWY